MHGKSLPTRVISVGPKPARVDQMRNVFRRPDATRGEMLFSPAFIDAETGVISPEKRGALEALMVKLAHRMRFDRRKVWTDTLAPSQERYENPSIPAGYTYFLQLVAHDMADSGPAAYIAGDGAAIANNARARPLMLDTIYGGGPDVATHAYAVDRAHIRTDGLSPRLRLRLGELKANVERPQGAGLCIMRDIARARPGTHSDDALDVSTGKLSEPLVADPRNDSNALVSQVTVLFHRLHNKLVDLVKARAPLADAPMTEAAYRHFNAARFAVAVMYRAIIRKDLLGRILHPAIHQAYAAHPDLLPLERGESMPLEFARGAFRFGHSMVRDEYDVNGAGELPSERNLRLSSRRNPHEFPMDTKWVVDWTRFFETGHRTPIFSHRISHDYPDALANETLFAELSEEGLIGLAHRDLLGSAFAGIWSVPALIEEMHARFSSPRLVNIQAALLRPYDTTYRAPMKAWLLAGPKSSALGERVLMTPEAAEAVAADPPLPFFVMFEAAHAVTSKGLSTIGMGRHLGPIGSILVAEAMHSALHATEMVEGEFSRPLQGNLAKISKAFLGDADALTLPPSTKTPETLPHLIEILEKLGGFD